MNRLRKLEAATLAASSFFVVATFLLVSTDHAAEANPVLDAVIGRVDWRVLALAKFTLVVTAFQACRHAVDVDESIEWRGLELRTRDAGFGGAIALAVLTFANAANDALVLMVNKPGTILYGKLFSFTAVVLLLAVLAFVRPSPKRLVPARGGTKKLIPVAFVFVIVLSPLSMVPVAFGDTTENVTTASSGFQMSTNYSNPDNVIPWGGSLTVEDKMVVVSGEENNEVPYLSLRYPNGTIKWETNGVGGGGVWGNALGPNNVYAGDDANGEIYRVDRDDPSNNETIATSVGGASRTQDLEYVNGVLYVSTGAAAGGDVVALDPATGSTQWSYSTNLSSEVFMTAYEEGGSTYIIAVDHTDGNVIKLDSSGNLLWENYIGGDAGGDVEDITYNSGKLVAGGEVNSLVLNPENGDVESTINQAGWGVSTDGSNVYIHDEGVLYAYNESGAQVDSVNNGGGYNSKVATSQNFGENVTLFTVSSDGSFNAQISRVETTTKGGSSGGSGNLVSGVATDQNGDPCVNCTIEVVGVSKPDVTPGAGETYRDRANELLDEASDPLPDSYDPDFEIDGKNGLEATASAEYVAIHDPEDWAAPGWTDDITLGDARINPEAGEPIVLSVWDPTKNSGIGSLQNTADADRKGVTVKRDIVIERLDPFDDVVDKTVYSENMQVRTGVGPGGKTHRLVRTTLPAGVYRIHPKGVETTGYTFVVGSERDLRKSFTSELETKAGKFTKAADDFQAKLNESKFVRKTDTTNATGHYNVSVPTGVEVVAVSAYSIDGTVLPDLEDASPQDMRAWITNNDYNGSVYFTLEPRRYNAPTTEADVTVRKFGSPPYQLLDEFADKWSNFRDLLENNTLSELSSMYNVPLEEWNRTQVTNGAKNVSKIVEAAVDANNEAIRDAYQERYNQTIKSLRSEIENGERTTEELRDDIQTLEEIILEQQDMLEREPPEMNVTLPDPGDDGPTRAMFRQIYGGDFSKEDVTATWHGFDGTVRPIDAKHISVNKRVGRGDEVVVDYPIPDDTAGGTISVLVVDEEGKIGRDRESVTNPRFNGTVPEITAIDVTTLRPGPSEIVGVEPKIDSPGATLESVGVWGADGEKIDAAIENGRATFTPGSKGAHFVELTINDSSGNTFVENFRLSVGESARDFPPEVRVRQGNLGTYALAGSEVSDASVEISDSGREIEATALVEPDSGVNEVHYYLSDAPSSPQQTVTARVVEGDSIETATSLSRHVGVYLHGRELTDDAIMYRSDSSSRIPIPAGQETKGGKRVEGENGGTVIHTYTDKSGSTSIEWNNDPSRIERAFFRLDVWFQGPVLPFGAISFGFAPAGDVVEPVVVVFEPVVDVATAPIVVAGGLVATHEQADTTTGVVHSAGVANTITASSSTLAHETVSPVTGVKP